MANKRDVDYTEVDRILNRQFTPVEINSTEENSNFCKIYDHTYLIVIYIII